MIPPNVSLVKYDNPVLVSRNTDKKTPRVSVLLTQNPLKKKQAKKTHTHTQHFDLFLNYFFFFQKSTDTLEKHIFILPYLSLTTPCLIISGRNVVLKLLRFLTRNSTTLGFRRYKQS